MPRCVSAAGVLVRRRALRLPLFGETLPCNSSVAPSWVQRTFQQERAQHGDLRDAELFSTSTSNTLSPATAPPQSHPDSPSQLWSAGSSMGPLRRDQFTLPGW